MNRDEDPLKAGARYILLLIVTSLTLIILVGIVASRAW